MSQIIAHKNIKYVKRYLDEARFYDPIAKYTMLFGFFELIKESKQYKLIFSNNRHIPEQDGKRIDQTYLDTLTHWGIKTYYHDIDVEGYPVRHNITFNRVKTIRRVRNKLFHENEMKQVDKTLYGLLFPITREIVQVASQNADIFKAK
mgnify:FL=1